MHNMKRRDFIKTGSLVVTGLSGGGQLSLAFVPDDFYDAEGSQRTIPFRKKPRTVREVVPGYIWADAADFDSYGGWALDTQFASFMGSSYLIAHGSGKPVKDATLRLKNLNPGRYRIWIRDKNWIPEYAPGRFGMAVNGKESAKIFGARPSAGWGWEDGGVHDITDRELTLALRDKTGYYGRCSSVLLTRDLDYHPPQDLDTFKKERLRLSGVADKPVEEHTYDVVVVGAGTAGCCAAIAAARLGARTALISDRPIVGGNASAEIGVPVQGAAQHHDGESMREGGIIEEAGRLAKARGWGQIMSRPFKKLIDSEARLDLFSDLRLEDAVEKSGASIQRIVLRHTLTGETYGFKGKFFIDTTGDGWLGHYADAEHRLGREARHEHNESLAPMEADSLTMSGCLRGPSTGFLNCLFYKTSKSRWSVKYKAPEWIYQLPPWEAWRRDEAGRPERFREARIPAVFPNGSWWIEHPNNVDDLWDPEFARDELLRINFTFWDFVKNKWPDREKAANFRLDYVPFTNGKRETRRLIGDYILNENDLMELRHFEDAIGHTGWTIDLHALEGIFDTRGMYYCDVRIAINEIPYRTLYSRNVDNLFMAGRNGSFTHVALGTTRVQGQTCVTGQAAATAAVLALKHGTGPRGVYEKHLGELQQQLLKDDQYIPQLRNEDPKDLARRATVRASSTQEAPGMSFTSEDTFEGNGDLLPLDTGRGVFFPWEPGRPLDSISVRLKAERDTEVTLHLLSATFIRDLAETREITSVKQRVARSDESWVSFPVDLAPRANFLWIYLEGEPSVSWRRVLRAVPNTYRFYGQPGNWTRVNNEVMAFHTSPEIPYGNEASYAPANIINGIARPTRLAANMWLSHARESLPQWIELELPEPSEVSAVHCVFDTDLEASLASQRDAFPDVCVRSYRIDCEVDGSWRTVASENLNFQRFRRHTFASVKTGRIRLTVEAMHGSAQARVIEIRAYRENGLLYAG